MPSVLSMIAGGLFARRAKVIEGTSISGDGWWGELGHATTKSGVDVTPWSSQTLSTVNICVNALAHDVGKVPVHLYRRLTPKGRERASDHPVYSILLRRPNPRMTPIVFMTTLMFHVLNWGNGYAEIERSKNGKPLALWIMRPDRVTILRNPKDQSVWYQYTDDQGKLTRIPEADVFHVHTISFTGRKGISIIQMAAEAIGAGQAANQSAASVFGKGGVPLGVLEHPARLKDGSAERLRQSWEDLYGGPNPKFRVAVLEEGLKFNAMSLPFKDLQLLESRQFTVAEICRFFRVAPHKAFDLSRATFSNIEQQEISYSGDSLDSWWVRIEQEANLKLLTESEQDELYFEFLRDATLRTDMAARYTAYGLALDKGFMNRDEVREKENLNPLPDGQGNLFTVQVNQIDIGDLHLVGDKLQAKQDSGDTAPSADPQPDAPPEGRKVAMWRSARFVSIELQPMIAASIANILRIESDKARRAAKRNELQNWTGTFYPDHMDHVGSALFPAVTAAMRVMGGRFGAPSPKLAPGLIARQLAGDHCKRSAAAIVARPVDDVLAEWENPYERAANDSVLISSRLAELLVERWEEPSP